MTRIRDRIEELEHKLDREGADFLNRRLLLRRCLEAAEAEAWQDGYHEGMQDAMDAHRAREQEALAGIEAHNAAGHEPADGS